LTITADATDQSHTIRLTPCCAVNAEVMDGAGRPVADTPLFVWVERAAGAGTPNIARPGPPVRRPAGPGRGGPPNVPAGPEPGRWQRVEEGRGYVPTPRTDAQGRATIWAAPGRGRIRVQATGYEESTTAEPIELPAGKEVKLRVELRATGQPPAKPAAAPPAPAAKPPTLPVTITGTATRPDGPVRGATIYLMTENGSASKLLATATTDALGRYEFRDTCVPLREPAGERGGRSVGLQVCGTAPGLAFAWKPWFSVTAAKPGPAGERPPAVLSPSNTRPASEPQREDLVFGRPEAFTGRVVDEQGRPVAGVKVRLRFGDWLRPQGAAADTSFWALGGAVPPAMNTTTTGADGRFRLGGVPQDFLGRLEFSHPDYAKSDVYAATADLPAPGDLSHFRVDPTAGPKNPVWTGEINVMLAAPRAVSVRVVSDVTGEPLADASIGLSSHGKVRVMSGGRANAAGTVSLRLPPGEYAWHTWTREKDYVMSRGKLTVAAEPAEQSHTVRLGSVCVLRLEAVDADSGRPVDWVQFRQESDGLPSVWESVKESDAAPPPDGWEPVEPVSAAGHYELPARTNERGELRVPVRPGKRRIIAVKPGYETVKGPTEPVELPAGKEVKLHFELRKKP
jgi:hypothetical protein